MLLLLTLAITAESSHPHPFTPLAKQQPLTALSPQQTVVCDSGDFATIGKYKPQDATTNPSLILAASKKPEYAKLIDDAVAYGVKHGKTTEEKIDATFDNLLVQFGSEILKIVPGKVSTEVDARFSFDKDVSIQKALRIIDVSGSVYNYNARSRLTTPSALQGGRH